MALNDNRATPSERLRNGHDFEPTNKWILFGHHFAAIAGPGPLVGPVLAAQFGYLPGTLWIIIGAVLGGAVQDFIILFASMRRDGKSLGEMAREEIGKVGRLRGAIHRAADHGDPARSRGRSGGRQCAERQRVAGTFTIAATMPVALFMGLYLRFWRLWQGAGMLGSRLRSGHGEHRWHGQLRSAASASPRAMVYLERHRPGVRHHRVWIPGPVLCPSDARCLLRTRLPQHLCKTGRRVDARFGRPAGPSGFANARADALRGWHRSGLRRQNLPVLLHHHRVWRHFGISCADIFRHNAKDDRQRI